MLGQKGPAGRVQDLACLVSTVSSVICLPFLLLFSPVREVYPLCLNGETCMPKTRSRNWLCLNKCVKENEPLNIFYLELVGF